jgi:hypothetical protein
MVFKKYYYKNIIEKVIRNSCKTIIPRKFIADSQQFSRIILISLYINQKLTMLKKSSNKIQFKVIKRKYKNIKMNYIILAKDSIEYNLKLIK